MKKIVLIGTIPPPAGGDASWAKDYLNYYKNKGIEMPLVKTSIIGKRASNVANHKSIIDETRRSIHIWHSIKKTIKLSRPDIIHMNVNCSPLGSIRDFISGQLIKKRSIPFVVHCHCNIEDQIRNSSVGKRFLIRLFNLSDAVITLNTPSFEFVHKVSNTKVTTIPNFIYDDKTEFTKEIQNDIKKILYVGHVKKEKGIDELFEVAKKYPNIEFIIAGPITDDYSEGMLATIPKNIKLTGSLQHEEVISLLDSSDVFLFPSYTEGFSIALLEAMSRGLPCIASDVGSNRDMLEDKGGILICPKSVDAIDQAIKSILDKKKRQKMSSWNINKVNTEYRLSHVIKRIEALYDEVIDEYS